MTEPRIEANAFEQLRLNGLATTADIRKVRDRARVMRSMSQDGQSAIEADLSERLLADTGYRIRQGALWYFAFASREEAGVGGTSSVHPHDRALYLWHKIQHSIATRQELDGNAWAAACQATCDLLNSPTSWLALQDLARDIGDARIRHFDVETAAGNAVATWIADALIAATALSQEGLLAARDQVRGASFSGSVNADIADSILRRCSQEITDLLTSSQPRLDGLIESVRTDASAGEPLIRAAEQFASALEPWVALIDGFDDDPETGEEGHSRDKAARLVREASVAVYNHTSLEPRALALMARAVDIAEIPTTKTEFKRDVERLSFLIAFANAARTLGEGNVRAAKWHAAEAGRHVSTDEEREQLAALSAALEQRSHLESLQMTPISSAPGLHTINGFGVRLYGASDYDRLTNTHCSTHYITALFVPVWPLARYRVRSLGDNSYQFLGKVPLRPGDIWHRWMAAGAAAVAGVFIIIASAMGAFDSSPNTQTSSPRVVPSSVPARSGSGAGVPTTGGASAGNANNAAAAAAKAKLEAERRQLEAQSSELDSLRANIDALKSRLNATLSQYPSGAPQYVIDQYESDRSRYNAMVADYNSKLAAYKSALAAFNAAVDDYNRRYVEQ